MDSTTPKLSLWTEGFTDDWYFRGNLRQRVERGKFDPNEITALINRIYELNGSDLDGLFLVQGTGKTFELRIQAEGIHFSDPQDPNYQNVAVRFEELPSFMKSHFSTSGDEAPAEPAHPSGFRIGLFAVLTLVLMGALYYLVSYMSQSSSFLPEADVVELRNSSEAEKVIHRFQGLYSTELADGAMLLELQSDGGFQYCDLRRRGVGTFLVESVNSGKYQPVYDSGRLALLTDTRFLFYPSDEALEFQGRSYKRLGKARKDVPFLLFGE